jgi:hypothetical protein
MRLTVVSVACLIFLNFAGAMSAQNPDPTVPQLLTAAGGYITEYERTFAVIVAEERYEQSTNAPTASTAPSTAIRRRATTSEFVMFNSGGGGWMVFRDVLAVDVTPVAEPGRLLKLVANPTPDTLAEAMRTTAASKRYNIGLVVRGVTVPTGTLAYLRRENQSQSTFELEGMKTIEKEDMAVLKFKATSDVGAPDETVTTGRFWIEPKSGRVVRTELTQTSPTNEAKVEVQYASQPGISAWVPVRMFEQYDVATPVRAATNSRTSGPTSTHFDGLSTYRNFRQFEAKPGLIIK